MFPKLDPLLHSELRLSIISLLAGVEEADFNYLKEQTGATSGNLSVQIDKLAEAGYIAVEKGFKGKMPRTTCKITPLGTESFRNYVKSLKKYISAGK
ncbi:MAG: transcriptional regulator [Bacteroidales bacterium]|nr:transcriptional regulator [Bacteroidales bacterium]